MNILVVGLNHKTANIEVREKLAFNGPALEDGLRKITALKEVHEVVILSTCNRVEIYAAVRSTAEASEAIKKFISEFHDIRYELLDGSLYFLPDAEGVRHVFRVASSLDSMVVGEPQILGQLKDAYDCSLRQKTSGMIMNKLMKKAISVAKRVRTETGIAENAVSISFAAVELAKKIFSNLDKKVVMLLGAGEMAELAARHLKNTGVSEILVANRTYETCCSLAEEFCGRPVRFDEFIGKMKDTDIVICSTGAPEYVVTKKQMQWVMKERKQKPVFVIDISVPRNIDPAINDMPNVFLYDVDSLQGVVDDNVKERALEAGKAEEIIVEEVETFERWQSLLDAVPTIVALRDRAEEIRQEEIDKLMQRLEGVGEQEKKAIAHMASAIVNKLVHPPTAALKEDCEDKEVLVATIRRLYGLDKDAERPAARAPKQPAPRAKARTAPEKD